MADVLGPRVYTRSELEEVARAAVREAAEEAEPERVEQLAGRVLREFDERRGSASGYTAEQISGTRIETSLDAPVKAGYEFPADRPHG